MKEMETDPNKTKVELDKKIALLESAIEKEMEEVSATNASTPAVGPPTDNEGENKTNEDLKQELRSGQEALERDKEVVEQREGK